MDTHRHAIPWAGIDLPFDVESHFGTCGTTGSGKTLALMQLLRAVVPATRFAQLDCAARRALVFDPENKLTPLLQMLAGTNNVTILNPFDARSRPWDLAKEVEDIATAQEIASILIPENRSDTQPFWQKTARGILSAVFKSLHIKAQTRWTLRHVFHIVNNAPRLVSVLKEGQQTQCLDLLSPTENAFFNVLAELRSHIDMLEVIAALWDSSMRVLKQEPFTVRSWTAGSGVLVFGRPTQLEETISTLNRVLMKRVSQQLRSANGASGRSWIFLDELRNVGHLPGLEKLLTEGRSRGVRVVMTFQDINGLREVYGQNVAEEIVNQCDTMSYLRCRGATAKWAAERLGRTEFWTQDSSSSHTSGGQHSSTTEGTSSRRHLTDSVLESEIAGLPLIKKAIRDGESGAYVQGWHVVPAIDACFCTGPTDAWYPFEDIQPEQRFVPRPAEHQIIRPWDDVRDWEELGFKPAPLTGEDATEECGRKLPDIEQLRKLRW